MRPTSLRTNGIVKNAVGNATAQANGQADSHAAMNSPEGPIARNVATPETMKLITPDNRRAIRRGAKRAGSLGMSMVQ